MSKEFTAVRQSLKVADLESVTEENIKEYTGVEISYKDLDKYLEEKGLSIQKVFISDRGFYPFWYIEEPVYISLPYLDIALLDMLQLEKRVKHQKEYLQNSWENEKYSRFFAMVDTQFTFDYFLRNIDLIPIKHQYPIFRDLYVRNYYGFNELNAKQVKSIFARNKGKATKQLKTDSEGYITVYRGVQDLSTSPESAYSWTTDLTVAERFATSYNSGVSDIFKAKIHLKDIIDFIEERSESEVLVLPEDIKDIEKVDSHFFDKNLIDDLQEEGFIEEYHYMTSVQLKESWFHNPQGIHGIKHIKRVMLLTYTMSYLDNLETEDSVILAYAALYHDIGRTHDNRDDKHGEKSVSKMKELKLPIPSMLNVEEVNILKFIIKYHAMNDKEGVKALSRDLKIQDKERALDLFKRFKDCDNLDRVRLGDLDSKYLRTETGKKLVIAAHQLYKNIL